MGNRIWREAVVKGAATGRKYIVDISGGLPIILCEIEDPNSFNPGSLKKSYYYADGQILSQRVHDPVAPNFYTPYFYVHDRLGSVRMVVDDTGAAVCSYTYRPYGAFYDGECVETSGVDNPWTFTGQYYDAEIEQYYLRARQYDPAMMRFTSRDPFSGLNNEPYTLHKYLYCLNSPTNKSDPSGLYGGYDDAAFFAAGAITGLIGQALSDLISGNLSSGTAYFAAVLGGGVGGWASLYAGAGGAFIGGFVQDAVATFVYQAANGAIDCGQIVGNGLIGGLIPGPNIAGITSGRGSFAAVTAQMVTKMRKGLINQFTGKTFSKIVAHNVITDAYSTGIEAWMESW
jgi:RHS repeat-associated protein